MGQGRPYSAVGKVMDELARARNVRGAHRIAQYMEDKIGNAPTGQAIAKWMYGDAEPKPDKIDMFARAFELTEEEKVRLSWAYAYRTEWPKIPEPWTVA